MSEGAAIIDRAPTELPLRRARTGRGLILCGDALRSRRNRQTSRKLHGRHGKKARMVNLALSMRAKSLLSIC